MTFKKKKAFHQEQLLNQNNTFKNMNQNLPTERNSICNKTYIYFHISKEVNSIVFLQYKAIGEIEFEECLVFPAWHLEEQNP